MKRVLSWTALALCVLVLLPASSGAMSANKDAEVAFHPLVTDVRGSVKVKGVKFGVWEPVEKGMLLLSGDVVRTEKGGWARIRFGSGTIEVYETTVMVIPSIGEQERKKDIREVSVDEGHVLFDINPRGVERGFEFRTKNVQGGVKGTLFTVSYVNDGTAVNVYRGVVEVSSGDLSEGSATRLVAGKALRVEKTDAFGKVRGFDPSYALEDYKYNIPPGLVENTGLPADYNASTKNQGARDRGQGHGRENAPGQETAPGQNR